MGAMETAEMLWQHDEVDPQGELMSIKSRCCRRLGMVMLALATTGFGGCALSSQSKRLSVISESLDATDITEIRTLLEAGSDVDVRNKYGVTPLWIASQKGHTGIVKLLLEAKADVNAARKTNGVTPLFMASQNGHTEVVKLLLAAKADVNAADQGGVTPLWIAVKKGRTEIVRLLLDAKAEVNAAEAKGLTAAEYRFV